MYANESISARVAIECGVLRLQHTRFPRLDAELLLRQVLGGSSRAWLLTHFDEQLTPKQLAQYQALLARRAQHEPIQYILGSAEFYGLELRVTPAVLIPRPETEHLVEAILELAPRDQPVRIADVGTGSGAIAIALAHHLPLAHVDALDLSADALGIASSNAASHGVDKRIHTHLSDLLSAVAGQRYDFIVSNPPYIADAEELEPQVARFEPHAALFAGPTGLEVYKRLIPQARALLTRGGTLALELGAGQHTAIAQLFRQGRDWEPPRFVQDLQGIPRVALARAAS